MEDYADSITAERVKRVIKGYGKDKKAVEGTKGCFDFYTLGEPIFKTNGALNESVGADKIREYIYYSETQSTISKNLHNDNPYFMGKHNDTAYYFYYESEATTTLDHSFLSTMRSGAEQYIIYADNCLLTKEFMTQHNIIFKKIPREIRKF